MTSADQPGVCLTHEEYAALLIERDRLRETGQAVVDRWDTPLWKEAEATGHVINQLRAALKGDQT